MGETTKIFSIKELLETNTTPGRADLTLERQFRKGYYYGLGEAVIALRNGASLDDLAEWVETVVFDWNYHQNYENCTDSPKFENTH